MKNKFKTLVFIICSFSLLLSAQENGSILCSDGIDNDGDGFIDCEDSECFDFPNNGCSFCSNGISFADTLLEYLPGCPHIDLEPEGALGVNDWTGATTDEFQFVFLGQGGIIKLGFTNNLLVNSGDVQDDLRVFEVGPAVEPCNIALRPADIFTETQLIAFGVSDLNGDGYYDVGSVMGAVSGVDIDALLPGFSFGELKFNAIEIMDIDDAPCHNGSVGADIDAVCALSYAVLDCADVLNGTAIIDNCGVCLELTDPNFNQSCIIEHDLYIPNVFSPNRDGINDRFSVFAADGTIKRIVEYSIFDRWGELVYTSSNFNITSNTSWWNGFFKQKKMQPAVFVYLIKVEFMDGFIKSYTGDVLLLR